MTKRIFETTLRSYQVRQPFRPFAIELTSGSILTIRHPEAVHTYAGAAAFIEPDGAVTIFDAQGVAQFSDRHSRRAATRT
jgi:hypothetical protein